MKELVRGVVLFLGRLFVIFPVLWYAREGDPYPWWMTTPDDDFELLRDYELDRPKHFGWYEPVVRRVYGVLGRYWGDVYWLGWRNKLYGLAYRWRVEPVKYVVTYDWLRARMERKAWRVGRWDVAVVYLLKLESRTYWQVQVMGLLVGFQAGVALNPIWNSQPGAVVRRINMDGRPVFGFRSAASLRR